MMKIFIILLSIFIVGGCEKVSNETKIYNNYIEELKETDNNIIELPFTLGIYIDKLIDNEVMYRVIIDEPKNVLKDIEVLVIHDNKTDDVFPSSGIFDEKYNLIPNDIEKESNKVKGIILAGYIPYDGDINNLSIKFKLLFKYKDENNQTHTIIYSTTK